MHRDKSLRFKLPRKDVFDSHEDLTREERGRGLFRSRIRFVLQPSSSHQRLAADAFPRASLVGAGISGAFALVSVIKPSVLAVPNRLWMKLGLLLAKVVSPIALGILFYLVFMPIGLLMRIGGKDPLRLKFDRDAKSYWIQRDPPGPPPTSMTNQF